MASSFTTSLRIEKPSLGEQSGIWGTTVNTSYDLMEDAIAGYLAIAMSDANITLTTSNGSDDQSRYAILEFTGTNTAVRDIIAPAVSKTYVIINSTNTSLRIKTSSGTGVTLSAGSTTSVVCDGTDFSAIGLDATDSIVAIAGVTPSADTIAYFNGSSSAASTSLTAFARTLLDDSSASTARTTLGLAIGTDVQAYSANLASFATVAPSANVLSLLAAASYAAFRALLTLDTGDTPTFTGINVGNSDTTITRNSAGEINVEGVQVATATNAITLTNKTLTLPSISQILNTGTLTLPTSTDTLVGRATTDTLTNKTYSGGTVSGTLAGSPTLSGTWTFSSPVTVATPVATTDAATKGYVDSVAVGLQVKTAVSVATTANITLSGEQTIDGVLTSASRVLVKDQTTTSQNGIYVSAAGAWSRATDMDTWTETIGALVPVTNGSTNASKIYASTASAGGTIGSTALTFSQFIATSGLQPLDSDLTTISAASNTAYGLAILTVADASALRTYGGLVIGTDVQAWDADLAALSSNSTNGLWARTGAGTGSARTITGTSNEITVTNGSGASGNPTISLPTALTFTGKTVTDGTFTTGLALTTGASTSRTFASHFSDYGFNAKDSGLVGDGSTSDVTALATLVARMVGNTFGSQNAAVTEKPLYFPPGAYVLTGSTISTTGTGQGVYGAGMFITRLEGVGISVLDQRTNIRDLSLTDSGSYGIDLNSRSGTNRQNCNIINVHIRDKDVGILLTKGTADRVTACTIEKCIWGIAQSLAANDSSGLNVSNTEILTSTAVGVYAPDGEVRLNQVTVRNSGSVGILVRGKTDGNPSLECYFQMVSSSGQQRGAFYTVSGTSHIGGGVIQFTTSSSFYNRTDDFVTNFGTTDFDATYPVSAATSTTYNVSFPTAALATTANITLSGEQTIDGTLTSGTTVLVKNQTTASQNGLYTSSSGAWSRVSPYNVWENWIGYAVWVTGGSTNGSKFWKSDATSGGTIGTTSLNFTNATTSMTSSQTGVVRRKHDRAYLVTGITDLGGGVVEVTTNGAHELRAGQSDVQFTGTTNYTGTYDVLSVTATNKFTMTATFVSESFSGTSKYMTMVNWDVVFDAKQGRESQIVDVNDFFIIGGNFNYTKICSGYNIQFYGTRLKQQVWIEEGARILFYRSRRGRDSSTSSYGDIPISGPGAASGWGEFAYSETGDPEAGTELGYVVMAKPYRAAGITNGGNPSLNQLKVGDSGIDLYVNDTQVASAGYSGGAVFTVAASLDIANTDTTITRTAAGQIAIEGVQVLTASNSVTVTGKTINGATLSGTLAGTPTVSGAWTWSTAQNFAASSQVNGSNIVSLSATQTLTNKTLTTPTINGGTSSSAIQDSSETSGTLSSASANKRVKLSSGATLPSSGMTDGDMIMLDPRGTARVITRPGSHAMYVRDVDSATATTYARNIAIAVYEGSSVYSLHGIP